MLNGDEYPYPTYYANVTGMGTNYFNFEQGPDGSSLTENYFINWLSSPAGRCCPEETLTLTFAHPKVELLPT